MTPGHSAQGNGPRPVGLPQRRARAAAHATEPARRRTAAAQLAAQGLVEAPALVKGGAAGRLQSIFLSETHQVNVQLLRCPFGTHLGDVAWLSIKRRDREVIRDWRELQAIKNAIVGPEHEGFELYPAESRLVDTANQFHLFVFMDTKVRMPVGFGEREVTGADAAAAVGATQRELPESA